MASAPRKPSTPSKSASAAKRARARERAARREQWERDFRQWIKDMDLALELFFASLPAEVRDKLDYSVESLDVLEAWLLARYPDSNQAVQVSEAMVIDGAGRYIGETFCKVLGGHWWVDTVHDTFHGWPQVTGFRTGPGSDSPLSMATACTNRRVGDFISSLLHIELAELPEPEPG